MTGKTARSLAWQTRQGDIATHPNLYQLGLDRTPANHVPHFLERCAQQYPDRTAIIHGELRQSWKTTHERCMRLASALVRHGVRRGDTVSILAPNTPAMVEAHVGVPLSGAVLSVSWRAAGKPSPDWPAAEFRPASADGGEHARKNPGRP